MKKIVLILALCLLTASCANAMQELDVGMSGENITVLTLRLCDLGFMSESRDVYDEYVLSAIADFQTANGLERTGTADEATMQVLYGETAVSRADYLQLLAEKYTDYVIDSKTVAACQELLITLGYYSGAADGSIGDATHAAISRYQSANGLSATGELDGETLYLMNEGRSVSYAEAIQAGCASSGASGANVHHIQRRLSDLGYYFGNISGVYGYNTMQAVEAFQERNKLSITGSVDEQTYRRLFEDQDVLTADASLLVIGYSGDDVFALQKRLVALGFLFNTPNGVFDFDTQTAVMLFKAANSMPIDDEVTTETAAVITGEGVLDASEIAGRINDVPMDSIENIEATAEEMVGRRISESGTIYAGFSFIRRLFAMEGIDTGSVSVFAKLFHKIESPSDCTLGSVLILSASTQKENGYVLGICTESGSMICLNEAGTVVKVEIDAQSYESAYVLSFDR